MVHGVRIISCARLKSVRNGGVKPEQMMGHQPGSGVMGRDSERPNFLGGFPRRTVRPKFMRQVARPS